MVSSNRYSAIARMLTYRPITELLRFSTIDFCTCNCKACCCQAIGPNVTCILQLLQLMHTDCGEVHALFTRSRFTIPRDRAGMQIPRICILVVPMSRKILVCSACSCLEPCQDLIQTAQPRLQFCFMARLCSMFGHCHNGCHHLD
jgi:hypothetical protein